MFVSYTQLHISSFMHFDVKTRAGRFALTTARSARPMHIIALLFDSGSGWRETVIYSFRDHSHQDGFLMLIKLWKKLGALSL